MEGAAAPGVCIPDLFWAVPVQAEISRTEANVKGIKIFIYAIVRDATPRAFFADWLHTRQCAFPQRHWPSPRSFSSPRGRGSTTGSMAGQRETALAQCAVTAVCRRSRRRGAIAIESIAARACCASARGQKHLIGDMSWTGHGECLQMQCPPLPAPVCKRSAPRLALLLCADGGRLAFCQKQPGLSAVPTSLTCLFSAVFWFAPTCGICALPKISCLPSSRRA